MIQRKSSINLLTRWVAGNDPGADYKYAVNPYLFYVYYYLLPLPIPSA